MRTALTLWSAFTFVVLWVGFVVVLVDDGREFESVDRWVGEQSPAAQVGLWILFLPIVVGLKAWISSSATLRVVGVIALLVWTAASVASLVQLITD